LDKNVLLTTLDAPFLDNPRVVPYLGILYLVAAGKRLGLYPVYLCYEDYPLAETKFQESNLFYTDEFRLDKEGADIGPEMYRHFNLIGISCFTPQASQAYRLLHVMKKINPAMQIIIGGPHATNYAEECAAQGFDAVCMGDGERIFEVILTGDAEMLSRMKHPLSSDTTLVLQDNLTEDEMNSYPIPVRQERYIHRYQYVLKDRLGTNLVNSRDCPMRCAFCEHGLASKKGRWHSVEHFEAEIASIRGLGYTGVMIFDDLFAISPKKVKPYLDVFKKHGDMTFRCFGHANVVQKYPEILAMLAEAGCVEMGFGAESASQKVLDNIEKRTTPAGLHNLVDRAVEAGIKVKAFFMIGLPGETLEDFRQTQDFIRHHRQKYPGNFDFDIGAYFPYKGSKIGKLMRLGPAETLKIGKKIYDRCSTDLRLRPDMDWPTVDSGIAGAYKQKGGGSDIVTEPYDWATDTVLLSTHQIAELQEETLGLGRRYTDGKGRRIHAPLMEGSIGAMTIESCLTNGADVSRRQIQEFIDSIEGWVTQEEGQALYSLGRLCAKGNVIVEIGSWKGKSTIWLGHGTKTSNNIKIYAVDPHTGSAQTQDVVGPQWTYPEFMSNIKKAGIEDIVVPLVMTSEEAAWDFQEPVGLVFIDGDHDYDMVKLDYEMWFPKLVSGGIMAFHDAAGAWPGPEQVVQEYLYNSPNFSEVRVVGSLVYGRKA